MIGLKAAVYEGEQRITSRGKRSISELRQLQQTHSSCKATEVGLEKNKGVAARIQRDQHDRSEESTKEDKVTAALRAKSELYNKIKSGSITVDSNSCLVNFGSSRGHQHQSDRRDGSSTHESHQNLSAPPTWSWSRGTEGHPGEKSLDLGSVNDEPTSVEDYKRRKISEMTFIQQVKEELSSQIPEDYGQENRGAKAMSAAARVKSQWEKTLAGTSKELLDQIHEETERGRREVERNNTTGL